MEISRRDFIKQTLGITILTSVSSLWGGIQKGKKPNILLIYTDDQNYEHLGCFGGNVFTPHQDGLAERGVMFENAFTTTAICTPSRYGLLTGQFPSRTKDIKFVKEFPEGVQTEVRFNTHLTPQNQNLASCLKNNGYKTGVVGKWDFGNPKTDEKGNDFFQKLPQPVDWLGAWQQNKGQANIKDPEISKILKNNHKNLQKYSQTLGFDYAEALYTLNPEMWQNHSLNIHNMEWVTAAALDFIDQSKDEPFFLYMAPTLNHIPHPQESMLKGDPHVTMEGYLDKIPNVMPPRHEIVKRVIKAGFPAESAFCTWLDDAIGAVVNKLKELKLYENTVIILMSDHQTHSKPSLYDGGVKTPLIIHYPKIFKQKMACDQLVQNIDITPTIFDIVNIKPSKSMKIDGKSILPILTGKNIEIHDELFFEYGWTRGIRTKDWKYIALRYSKSSEKLRQERGMLYQDKTLEPMQHNVLLKHPNYWDSDQLYNLKIDPGETTNFANDPDYIEILNFMKIKMKKYLKSFGNHPFGEFVE